MLIVGGAIHSPNVRAKNDGGALLADGISSVTFAGRSEGNTANRHGGGFASRNTASITLLSGAIFVHDSAVGSGGCAYLVGGAVSLRKLRSFFLSSL